MATYEGDTGSDARNEPVTFNTLQEAKECVYADVRKLKYGIAILRSIPDRKTGEVRRVDMVCNRSTTYKAVPSENPRIKNSSSVKTACPWKIILIKYKGKEKWQLEVADSNHNHEPAEELSGLADHRRRDIAAVYEAIDQAIDQAPADLLDNLRKDNPDTTIQPKDLANARARLRSRRLGKYTPTQALLRALYRNNWFMKFVLKANSKRVSNDSRICIAKQADLQAGEKTVLRQQARGRYSTQESRDPCHGLHLQNQQISNVIACYHGSHCFRHQLLHRLRVFGIRREGGLCMSVGNAEGVV